MQEHRGSHLSWQPLIGGCSKQEGSPAAAARQGEKHREPGTAGIASSCAHGGESAAKEPPFVDLD